MWSLFRTTPLQQREAVAASMGSAAIPLPNPLPDTPTHAALMAKRTALAHLETALQHWHGLLRDATAQQAALGQALSQREERLADQVRRLAEEHASLEHDAAWLEAQQQSMAEQQTALGQQQAALAEQRAALEVERGEVVEAAQQARALQAQAANAKHVLDETTRRLKVLLWAGVVATSLAVAWLDNMACVVNRSCRWQRLRSHSVHSMQTQPCRRCAVSVPAPRHSQRRWSRHKGVWPRHSVLQRSRHLPLLHGTHKVPGVCIGHGGR